MSAKLQSLIVSYCGAFPRDVQTLALTLSPAPGGPLGNVKEALERVHRIKGAGGSLGFEAVSRAAAQLEMHLRALNATAPAANDDGGLGPVLESLTWLKELAATVKPEGSTLYGIDLSRMAPPARGFAARG